MSIEVRTEIDKDPPHEFFSQLGLNILTSGTYYKFQGDIGKFIRLLLVNTIGIVAGACLLFFGTLDIVKQVQPTGWIITAVGLMVVANFFFLRQTKKVFLASWVAALLLWGGFAYLLATGGNSNTGPLWIYTLPGAMLVLLGVKIGSWFIFTFFVYSALVLFVPGSPFLATSYPWSFTIRFIPTLITSAALGYIFEYMRSASQKAIIQSHREMKKTVLLLDSVLDAIPDIIRIQDLNHRVIRYNRAGNEFFQVSSGDLSCKNCYHFMGEEQPCDPCINELALSTGKPAHFERYFDALGLWLDCRSYPVFNEEGEIIYAVEQLRDISDRKAMEEEALRARKIKSIGTLAGGIAHDFNNLLTAIMGNISCARLELPSHRDLHATLEEAEQACLQAKNLTHQLLTFSKGGFPIKKTMDISNLLKEAASFALSGSSSRLELLLAEDLALVEVDPGQINQVISNVVINATQAMPQGGTVVLRAENIVLDKTYDNSLSPGKYVKISIKDEGKGIEDKDLERIFDPYFTTRPGGTGLGLATVYSIVQNHQGQIKAESVLGMGSVFSIYLPVSRQDPEPELKKQDLIVSSGGEHILVMDDEESIRRVAKKMLSQLGYEVTVASDGAEALKEFNTAIARGCSYSAVVLDLTVPGGMGGKKTLKEIRKLSRTIPVIVSSGYSTQGIMSNFREEGFSDILAKPYKLSELSAVLFRCLNKRLDEGKLEEIPQS